MQEEPIFKCIRRNYIRSFDSIYLDQTLNYSAPNLDLRCYTTCVSCKQELMLRGMGNLNVGEKTTSPLQNND